MGEYTSKYTGEQIDNLLGQVENGGGTGDSSKVTLWEGNSNSGNSMNDYTYTFNLTNPITEFAKLGFYLTAYKDSGTLRYLYREIPVDLITNLLNSANTADEAVPFCWGYSATDDYFDIKKTSTVDVLEVATKKIGATKIVGIGIND